MATTKVKKLSNGYSYKYSDLSTIHDELEKQDITYSQEIRYNPEAQADYIWTTLIIDGEKQEPKCGCRVITGKLSGGNAAQEQGSALTYARRYSLLMALGWATEDDDAQSVGSSVKRSEPKPTKSASGGLNFDQLKEKLSGMDEVAKVMLAKASILEKYPNLSEKQRQALNRIFSERCDQIQNPGGVSGWQK